MTNEDAYYQGFVDKCAEYGVDPETLIPAAPIKVAGVLDSIKSIIKAIGGAGAKKVAPNKHIPIDRGVKATQPANRHITPRSDK